MKWVSGFFSLFITAGCVLSCGVLLNVFKGFVSLFSYGSAIILCVCVYSFCSEFGSRATLFWFKNKCLRTDVCLCACPDSGEMEIINRRSTKIGKRKLYVQKVKIF